MVVIIFRGVTLMSVVTSYDESASKVLNEKRGANILVDLKMGK